MTTAPQSTWLFPVLRAIPAAVVALFITFSADHSATLGSVALGAFAIITGCVVIFSSVPSSGRPPVLLTLQGGALLGGGVAALVIAGLSPSTFLYLCSILLGATGVLELLHGMLSRGTAVSRDHIFLGALGAVFAVVILLVPADFVQVITIPGKVVPPLTAPTIVVGLLGAYAAIVAVYLVIAGLSLKWAPSASTTVSEA